MGKIKENEGLFTVVSLLDRLLSESQLAAAFSREPQIRQDIVAATETEAERDRP